MTTYLDYSATPGNNNSPPPVGAPEGWPPSSVNDVVREMMSVVRQLGDQVQTTFAGLGDMSKQSSTAVAITGGAVTATLAGPGSAVTALNATQLTSGTVPAAALSGTYGITVTQASNADTLGGISLASLLAVGMIVMYMGNLSNVDTNHWAVCDGTRGTPNLVNRYPCGTNATGGLVPFGGGASQTDTQGVHAHGGASQPHQLIANEMPSHQHTTQIPFWTNGGGNAGYIGQGTGGTGPLLWNSFPVGGDQPHTHGITSDGGHYHTFQAAAPYSFGLWFLMRVA